MRHMHQPYEMVVRPKGRTPADEYPHKGDTWIEGRHNSWYEIDLYNHSHFRVQVILSVDGVGVIDGVLASYQSKGFVIPAHGKITVPGWVQSAHQAAQFVFADETKSYANPTSKGGNPGVIGSAWFPEGYYTPHIVYNTWSASNNLRGHTLNHTHTYQGMASASHVGSTGSMDTNLGTSWGPDTSFATIQVEFVKASPEPSCVMVLRYASADKLKALGIKLKDRSSPTRSSAFPGNTGYCAPPPVWVQNKTTT